MMKYIYKFNKLKKDILNWLFKNKSSDDFIEVDEVKLTLDKISALIDFGLFYVDRENTGADSSYYKRGYRNLKEELVKELEDNIKKLNLRLDLIEKKMKKI